MNTVLEAAPPPQARNYAFKEVPVRCSFHKGVNGKSTHGKCFKLCKPTSVMLRRALRFSANAVSESGVLLMIEEDDPVFFSPASDGESAIAKNGKEIILALPYLNAAETCNPKPQFTRYVLATGQLV